MALHKHMKPPKEALGTLSKRTGAPLYKRPLKRIWGPLKKAFNKDRIFLTQALKKDRGP